MNPMLLVGGMQLLGGLFQQSAQRKENAADRAFQADAPRRNLMSQAKGARQAAEAYGFNPLTMMQLGQTGAGPGGGSAPLASTELISQGLSTVGDVLSGDAERRSQAAELQNDLLRLQIEQLRGAVARPSAASAVGSGAAQLGARSVEGAHWFWDSRMGADVQSGINWVSDLTQPAREWVGENFGMLADVPFRPIVPYGPDPLPGIHDLSTYERPLGQAVSPAEERQRSVMAEFPPRRPRSRQGRPYVGFDDDYSGRSYGFGLPFGFFRQ